MAPPRILNPRAVPIAGVDAHLPGVPAQRLTEAALRERFAQPPPWKPEFRGDGRTLGRHPAAPAAVLVPLIARAQGIQVLLTRRTEHLRDHAGQISFPGGRAEPNDPSPAATALREAEEEIGLRAEHVEVLGELPHYTTVTSYVVTPVVALVRPPFALELDRFEVAEAFEVPLDFLMTPAHHRRHVIHFEGQERQFLSMPWPRAGAAAGTAEEAEHFIWGATAAMLRNLYRFLAA